MKQFIYSSADSPIIILQQFHVWRRNQRIDSDTEVLFVNMETGKIFTNTVYNQIQELREAIREI